MALSLTFATAGSAIPAAAGVLNSQTVTQLTYPGPCPGCTLRYQGAGKFTHDRQFQQRCDGNIISPVAPPWQGTFSATGLYPSHNIGTSIWNFSALPGNVLAAGTFVGFGDLDFGSGDDERFTLTATFHGSVVTTPLAERSSLLFGRRFVRMRSGPRARIQLVETDYWNLRICRQPRAR